MTECVACYTVLGRRILGLPYRTIPSIRSLQQITVGTSVVYFLSRIQKSLCNVLEFLACVSHTCIGTNFVPNVVMQGAQILCSRSPWQLNLAKKHLIFVGTQVKSPSRHLESSGGSWIFVKLIHCSCK